MNRNPRSVCTAMRIAIATLAETRGPFPDKTYDLSGDNNACGDWIRK
ncbi:hypothetical protein M7I_0158 [Glarea lozoyensis 74030]|uniref:Uncharacterized protein n=1 Tax=Glarea lozoyensis (strain ATCC 74030 / MF5533) TaxID=1104152 RepID=H0ECL6_GLAL7|nr:hypothetical protein M7I_0158 [Glarea lozoyensis 74030]